MKFWLMLAMFSVPHVVAAGSYPTIDTVKFVVGCMVDNGGQTEENLYACACRFDVVSSEISFEEYEEASLYERYRRMPGKRGALFRDSEKSEKLTDRLADVRKKAASRCPLVKRIGPASEPD